MSRQEKGGWGYELRAREQVLLPWPICLQSSMALRAAKQARATRRQCPLAYLTANLSLHSPPALIGMVAPHLGRCSHLHPTGKEAQTQRGKGSCPPPLPEKTWHHWTWTHVYLSPNLPWLPVPGGGKWNLLEVWAEWGGEVGQWSEGAQGQGDKATGPAG